MWIWGRGTVRKKIRTMNVLGEKTRMGKVKDEPCGHYITSGDKGTLFVYDFVMEMSFIDTRGWGRRGDACEKEKKGRLATLLFFLVFFLTHRPILELAEVKRVV